MVGLLIHNLEITSRLVLSVAVAVSAITLTEVGTKLRTSPSRANSSLKESPL